MAKQRRITLRFPSGGMHERVGYQVQPPYTTPNAQNVRADATIEARERGGSRPGLDKSHVTELGSGEPIRSLGTVTYTRQDNFLYWMDIFPSSTLNAAWSTASWLGTDPGLTDNRYASLTTNGEVGLVRSALTGLDTSSAYRIELFVVPYQGEHFGSYQVFARMGTTPVVTTDGIEARFNILGTTGIYSGALDVYVSGVKTSYAFTGGTDGTALAGWFTVLISSDTVTCYWRGTQLLSQAITTQAGSRFGFGMTCTESDGVCLTDTFRIQYNSSTAQESRWPLLVASANGTVYYESTLGTFTAVTSDVTVAADRQVQCFEAFQKLYFVNHGDYKTEQTDGVVGGASSNEMTSASIADWDALSIDTDNDVLVIEDASDETVEGTYAITAVAETKLTFSPAASGAATSCEFRVERGPTVYDPSANTHTLWTATSGEGEVPTGGTTGCLYRGRAVLAGNKRHPHLWWMSRQDDLNDWNYDETDSQRAVSGMGAEAGEIGEPVNAVVSHNDDLCLFGCTNSLWVLRGDVTYGGQIQNLSHEVGIIDKKAWCYTPDGYLIFLSRDGLYGLAPGANTFPEPVSRMVLPRRLRYVDTANYDVLLEWDNDKRGVHVYLTSTPAASGWHWWFDWETKGFLPVSLPSTSEPTSICAYKSLNVLASGVLLGCRDGYVRRYRDEWETDGGTEITSYVEIGPFRLWTDDVTCGLIQQVDAVLAEDSGDVTLSVFVGKTPEAAVDASAFASKTLSEGRNNTWRPRARGAAAILRLENADTDRAWALESLTLIIEKAGRIRA